MTRPLFVTLSLWMAASVFVSRPIRLRVVVPLAPPSAVNAPPTRIFPSASCVTDHRGAFAPGLKLVSIEPSAFSLPIPFRALVPVPPPSIVKSPPTKIFPSVCTASV